MPAWPSATAHLTRPWCLSPLPGCLPNEDRALVLCHFYHHSAESSAWHTEGRHLLSQVAWLMRSKQYLVTTYHMSDTMQMLGARN